ANASDFSVNGIPANSVSLLDATDLVFHFSTSPVVGQGVQTMAIAAGAIHRLSDGGPIEAFSATFRYDAVLLEVTSTLPKDGSAAQLPLASIQVDFNEPYDPGSIGTDDLSVTQGSVTSFTLVDADTVQYNLTGVTQEGTLGLNIAAGAVTDAFG